MRSPAPKDAIATRFGFEDVDSDAKQARVNDVFADVAERYDLMNDLMSGGLHRLWKAEFVTWLAPPRSAQKQPSRQTGFGIPTEPSTQSSSGSQPPTGTDQLADPASSPSPSPPYRLLDVAGGTGDIAMRVCKAGGSNINAVLCDISPQMLMVGTKRVAAAGLADQISFTVGNAESLPFPDKQFDAYTIAFGIRNVTHIDHALREAYRVLRPGGRFMCLEFSQVQIPLLDRLYDFHSFEVIPRLGKLAAGAAQPYQYLVESIRNFPDQERFKAMINEAGFDQVSYRNLTGGVAAIHSAWRI